MNTTIPAAAWATVFLLCSAFFSASETALFSIPRERIPFYASSNRKTHRWVYLLLRDGQRTLLLILLGNLFVNVTIVGLVHTVVSRLLSHPTPLATLFVATAVILVFGEILPKNIALRFNESLAVAVSPLLYHLRIATAPFLSAMQRVNSFFLTHFRLLLRRPSPYVTLDELKGGIDELERTGALSKREHQVIAHILDAGSAPVSRNMKHRLQVLSVADTTPVPEVIRLLQSTKNASCIVRAGGGEGEILGFAYLSGLLGARRQEAVGGMIVEAEWVPGTLDTAELIGLMIEQERRDVCVLDEFGVFVGVFSLAPALEKVVGMRKQQILADNAQESERTFDGLQELDAIPDWIPSSMKEEALESRTLNGLITRHLGKIPKTGEIVAIDDRAFYIIKAKENRIETILVRKKDRTYDS